jgi:predicted transcriptional regulator of viral defense system
MKRLDILKRLKSLPTPVFTIADLMRVTQEKRSNAHVYLSRMKKAGLIYEIERGKYSTSKDPLLAATSLLAPSYISFLYGMNLRGMTDQIATKIQVIVPRQKKKIFFQDIWIEFIRFKRSAIFGYRKEKKGEFEIFLADPEKLLIDSLYMPHHVPVSEVFKALAENEFNEKKLLDYAKRMDSKVLLKRLGYLLDRLGSDYSKELRISAKLEYLNPSKKKKGEVDKKWKLIINEVIEDA